MNLIVLTISNVNQWIFNRAKVRISIRYIVIQNLYFGPPKSQKQPPEYLPDVTVFVSNELMRTIPDSLKFPTSRLNCDAPFQQLSGLTRVCESADPFNLYRHLVSCFHKHRRVPENAHTLRTAGQDNIPGNERKVARQETD